MDLGTQFCERCGRDRDSYASARNTYHDCPACGAACCADCWNLVDGAASPVRRSGWSTRRDPGSSSAPRRSQHRPQPGTPTPTCAARMPLLPPGKRPGARRGSARRMRRQRGRCPMAPPTRGAARSPRRCPPRPAASGAGPGASAWPQARAGSSSPALPSSPWAPRRRRGSPLPSPRRSSRRLFRSPRRLPLPPRPRRARHAPRARPSGQRRRHPPRTPASSCRGPPRARRRAPPRAPPAPDPASRQADRGRAADAEADAEADAGAHAGPDARPDERDQRPLTVREGAGAARTRGSPAALPAGACTTGTSACRTR